MAEQNKADLSLEDTESQKGASNKKLMIIIAVVVLLLAGAAAAYFLLFSDDSGAAAQQTEPQPVTENASETLAANYVAMPRPFVFNVMEGKRDRLVQIKIQLMVRGSENALLAKKHIPLLEGTLVRVFSSASAEQLRSPVGKTQLREYSLQALNEATTKVENKALVDQVLFTGFVLQ